MVAVSDRALLERLRDRAEREIRPAWFAMLDWLMGRWSVARLEQALPRDLGLLYADIDRAVAAFVRETATVTVAAGEGIAELVSRAVKAPFTFESTAPTAVEMLRADGLRLVRGITDEQRAAFTEAIASGMERGDNPRVTARALRGSLGLTQRQQQAVANYRRALEQGSQNALDRALRDRRFDRTVERAVAGDTPLTSPQIDRMVDRYRERYIAYRAEVVARTEALRAVHGAAEETYRQALVRGDLDPHEIQRKWLAARDRRTRDSHRAMDGQLRPIGEAFRSGDGYALRHPGDPNAPASETVQCRCMVVTRLEAAPV